MHLRPAVIVSTLVALAACGTRPADTAPSMATDAVPPAYETACRQESFEHFLSRFENDAELQKQATSDPLDYGSIDASAEPEPRMVMQRLQHRQIEFPLYPSARVQDEHGLIRSIRSEGNGEAEVMLRKPDTDYQLVFHFHRKDRKGCWELTSKVDESL